MEAQVRGARSKSAKLEYDYDAMQNAPGSGRGRMWMGKEVIPSFPTLDELNEALMSWDSIKPLSQDDLSMLLI